MCDPLSKGWQVLLICCTTVLAVSSDKSCWYAVQLSWLCYLTMIPRLGRPWIQGFLLQIKTLFSSTSCNWKVNEQWQDFTLKHLSPAFWKPLGHPAFSSKHTNLSFTWSQRIGMKTNYANIFSAPDSRVVGAVVHSSTFPLWISQPAKSHLPEPSGLCGAPTSMVYVWSAPLCLSVTWLYAPALGLVW